MSEIWYGQSVMQKWPMQGRNEGCGRERRDKKMQLRIHQVSLIMSVSSSSTTSQYLAYIRTAAGSCCHSIVWLSVVNTKNHFNDDLTSTVLEQNGKHFVFQIFTKLDWVFSYCWHPQENSSSSGFFFIPAMFFCSYQ